MFKKIDVQIDYFTTGIPNKDQIEILEWKTKIKNARDVFNSSLHLVEEISKAEDVRKTEQIEA